MRKKYHTRVAERINVVARWLRPKGVLWPSLFLLAVPVLGSSNSRAAQIDATWDVPVDGFWSVPENWDIARSPNNGGGDTFSVFIDGIQENAVTVMLDINAVIDGLSIDAGDTVQISQNQALTVATISNAGMLDVGADATLWVPSGGSTLAGGGSVVLTNDGSRIRYNGRSSGVALTNTENTISGVGRLGDNTMRLVNQSVVDANQPDGVLTVAALDFGPSSTNTGVMRSSNGGILRVAGSLDNTDGLIEAQGNSTLEFTSGALASGRIVAGENATMRLVNGAGVSTGEVETSASSVIEVPDGNSGTLGGTISNAGMLDVGADATLWVPSGGLTLAGGGSVVLTNDGSRIRYNGRNSGVALTNTENTISGVGRLGDNTMRLVNQSVVDANQPDGVLTVATLDFGPPSTNTGVMRSSNGGILRVAGSLDNTDGLIEAQGNSTLEFTSGALAGGRIVAGENATMRLVNGAGVSTGEVETSASSVIEVPDGNSGTLGGTISNAGMLDVGADATLWVPSGGSTLAGGGSVVLTNDGSRIRYNGRNSGVALTNTENTISGVGRLGDNTMRLVNQSVVDANQPDGVLTVATLDFGPPSTNTGVMRSSNGGILRVAGSLDNTDGLIEAQGNSTLEFTSGALAGGRIVAGENATMRLVNGAGVSTGEVETSASSVIEVPDGNSGTLGGTISNAGMLDVGADATLWVPSGGSTLAGGGSVVLTNDGSRIRYNGRNSGVALTNTENTISGVGRLGDNTMRLVNQSVVDANQPDGVLTVATLDFGPSSTNTGVMRSSNGGILRVAGSFDNTDGLIEAQGNSTLEFTSGTIRGGRVESLGPGVIRGNGVTIEAAGVVGSVIIGDPSRIMRIGGVTQITNRQDNRLENLRIDGRLEFGFDPDTLESGIGSLNLFGSVEFSRTATIEVEIHGLQSGQFDHISSTGTLNLAGALDVQLIDDFAGPTAPGTVETITVINASNVSGTFSDRVQERHLGNGLFANPVYAANEVALDLLRAMPGDANGDKEFDQQDIVLVQQAAKYLTGEPADWVEGDWDNARNGGDGVFNQLDIIAALTTGAYLTGPYAAVQPNEQTNDCRASIVYDASTGELAVDTTAGTELTSINIDSASHISIGDVAENLGGSFDNAADNNIFKATFGGSFGSLSFGNVAQSGFTEGFLLGDLTVVGSLQGGGSLGDVDLIYVPEPSTVLSCILGALVLFAGRRRVLNIG